ncbi:MAG: MFS family permease [Phenylobacterium sp.]
MKSLVKRFCEEYEMESVVSISRLKQLPMFIWVMMVGNFFVRGTYYMVWPFLSVILIQKYNLSAAMVGLILTGTTVASIVLGVYAGNLSDRIGRKSLMYLAAVIGVGAFMLLSVADSLVVFVTAVFLATLPRSLWDSPSKAMMADALPDGKDRELALQGLYFMTNAGAALGPLFGIWAGLTGQQSSFILTAYAYIGLIIALILVFKQSSRSQPKQQKSEQNFAQTLRLLATDQVFLVLIIANILIMFIYAQGDTSLIQYLTRANAPDLVSLIASMIILNSVVIVTCQFPLLKLLENFPVKQRIYIGIGLLAISQLVYAFNPVDYYTGWLIATFVLSVAEAILFPNMNVQLDQLAPAHLRGSYFGAASLYSLGFGFAPLIGGIVLDTLGGPALFIMGLILCLLVGALYLATGRLKRPDFTVEQGEPV